MINMVTILEEVLPLRNCQGTKKSNQVIYQNLAKNESVRVADRLIFFCLAIGAFSYMQLHGLIHIRLADLLLYSCPLQWLFLSQSTVMFMLYKNQFYDAEINCFWLRLHIWPYFRLRLLPYIAT